MKHTIAAALVFALGLAFATPSQAGTTNPAHRSVTQTQAMKKLIAKRTSSSSGSGTHGYAPERQRVQSLIDRLEAGEKVSPSDIPAK